MNPSQSPRKIPRDLRTVFLDRDGVLNRKMPEDDYVTHWEKFEILPGVPEALARLKRAGLRLIVVSNQRGIARWRYTAADVDAMHRQFQELLATHGAEVDAFFICPHDEGACNCRKPLTGLFDQAVARFPEISAESSVMIGDSWKDVAFGHALGMAAIQIEGGHQSLRPGAGRSQDPADLCFDSLAEAVDALMAMCGK